MGQEQVVGREASSTKELGQALGKALIVSLAWQASGLLEKDASKLPSC